MLSRSNDLPELEAVEVSETLDAQVGQAASSEGRFKIVAFFKQNVFFLLTMIAIASGTGLGFALRHIDMSARTITYLTFPGELLLRLLQMLVLPLIISTLITGVSSVNRRVYGSLGLRAVSFYMVTTVIAVITGIALAFLIQPGKSSTTSLAPSSGDHEVVHTVDSFLDFIRNMIPSNLVEACFRKYKTVYRSTVPLTDGPDVINGTENNGNNNRVPVLVTSDGINMVGLLFFSVAFGLILGNMGPQGEPLRNFFECLNNAIMHLIRIFIWYSPVGTFFLLTGHIVKMTHMAVIGHEVAMYTFTVIMGLLLHSLLTLPLIYFTITRKNPFRFMGGLFQVLVTAFGTSSSSATLPVTLHCLEENHNMDTQVTRFMLPIGATMNMDGAALYEVVAALFIAQINNIEFNPGETVVLSLIVTAVSTGAAGIPQAGMVSMLMVLTSVGLPTKDIALLLMVDWILDRLRTATNVLGDCIGVGVVQHLSRHELQRALHSMLHEA
ncbi:uncharacterized protein V6R79_025802 [Siganus canaliculatus]